MSADDIDAYLAGVDEPGRSTLEAVRRSILAVVPDAEQCISYRMPAFRVRGRVVAGLAAFTRHLASLPHSGSVLPALATSSPVTSRRRARCTSRPTRHSRPRWSSS